MVRYGGGVVCYWEVELTLEISGPGDLVQGFLIGRSGNCQAHDIKLI